MSNKDFKKCKGDIYAFPLPEKQGYIYFYYLTGNFTTGDLIVVFNYSTKEIENDMQKILSQPSLYEQKLIVAFLKLEEKYIKVGNIKPNFKELMQKAIYVRTSIEYSKYSSKYHKYDREEAESSWKYKLEDIKNGIRYHCNDWDYLEYRVLSERGKFAVVNRIKVGEIPENERHIFLANIGPYEEDFVEKYLTGYDRNSILYTLFI